MHTCCPNCLSPSAIGTDAASVCTECVSVSVAGLTLPVGLMVASALTIAVLVVSFGAIRRRVAGWGARRRLALPG